MYPRSGFLYRRSVFRTLVLVLGVYRSVFCALVPVVGVQGTPAKTTLLETTLCEPQKKQTGFYRTFCRIKPSFRFWSSQTRSFETWSDAETRK